jgi:hypothetical protein
MKEPKYAVYPGPVRSRTDGQEHHIGARELMFLYGVEPSDCLIVWPHEYTDPSARSRIDRAAKLPALCPRFDGDYKLPEKKEC